MTTATSPLTTEAKAGAVPPFVPHPWVWNGHLQTIVGRYLVGSPIRLPSTYHEVDAGGGDRLAALESIPTGWREGGPSALLVHGLAGCARAPA